MAVKLFECYGRFCAQYALEVIVCFLTMVVGAITLNVSSPYELCHWATSCTYNSDQQKEVSSDVVLLTILRCGTIIYLYIQSKDICKTGSVLLVGIVSAYTIFAVMTFSVIIVHFLSKDFVVMSNALPVFLLLTFVDISRVVLFTQHCLSVKSIYLLQDYIAEAMGVLMPPLTINTLIQLLLLINIGGYVQIYQVQRYSCFACLSVIINYIVFATFVPACLSVYLAVSNKTSPEETVTPSWYDVRFSKALQSEQGRHHIFTNRMTFFISSGLLILCGIRPAVFQSKFAENVNKMQSRFDSIFTLTPEQMFSLALIIILGSKYLVEDYEIFTKVRNKTIASTSETKTVAVPAKAATSMEYDDDSENCALRSVEKCMELLQNGCSDLLTNAEIISLVDKNKLPPYKLETILQDANRGVLIRRMLINRKTNVKGPISHIPYMDYDFTTATKACCENTIGYIPIPIGTVGPLLLNKEEFMVPMATTEGTLLASTNRGLKALYQCGGASACTYNDGMSRAPVVSFPSVEECCSMASWLQDSYNFKLVKEKFNETSRFARLKKITPVVSGRLLYIRFVAQTGDAMGMNMVSKGTENALRWLKTVFQHMKVVSLSGNFCTDKKPSAVNWIEGRGKSVVCEAVIPADVVKKVLKTDVTSLVYLSHCKNHIGSAMAGSIGGYNAHSANIVTAIFIATGQDPAQNVVSSNCMTTLQVTNVPETDNEALLITCTMPSIEVATVGGGTALEPQKACLNLLGVAGSSSCNENPGDNASKLARIICATVLAGELSLLSALNTGDLVQSHMKHNRLPNAILKQKSEHNIL